MGDFLFWPLCAMVLYVYCVSFSRPAGRKNDTQRIEHHLLYNAFIHPHQIKEAYMTAPASALQPQRTIDELKELRVLTGDAEGAQRVAFTDTWATARAWMRAKLEQLPVEITVDQAGK